MITATGLELRAGTRILREIADRQRSGDVAAVRLTFTREDAKSGCLTGAVTADKADTVAMMQAQGGIGQQDPRPGPEFQTGSSDHVSLFYRAVPADSARAATRTGQ